MIVAYNASETFMYVTIVLIFCSACSWGAWLVYRHQNKPSHVSRRVQQAMDDATVAEQHLRADKAKAQSEIVEVKKQQLLDAASKGDDVESKMRDMTTHLQLEQKTRGY